MVSSKDTSQPPERGTQKTQQSKKLSFLKRLREKYSELPGSEQKIADIILDTPSDIATYSATELAERAGGSKAAITRLIQRLGYENYESARRDVRDSQAWGSPVSLARRQDEDGDFASRLRSQIDQDIGCIHDAFGDLTEKDATEISDALIQAPKVWIIGYRSNQFLAGYFRWQLIQARPDVHLLPKAGETLGESLADIGKKDLLVVMGLRRRTPLIDTVLNWSERNKVRSFLITDPTSRATGSPTWTHRCDVRGREVLDRYQGVMSLLHFFSMSVLDRAGAQGRKRLTQLEEIHGDLDQFV
ncbi:MurR/RpiR family transcriptional regulator [Shimia sp. R9_1]|uniref:MurR/RpiR family transcriptional regulator n=1 Tax=Shimia sp. R9_1 TaxID=2821111 RepID=UPI001AD9A918|nr:MurR/RpiR family transcriptional regulator [Shimia sp. R9_1]MBO9409751.1 MurR/RpiR family transcriptional regulator [Shimia sp. R9_1]